jgi:hypothetical protein
MTQTIGADLLRRGGICRPRGTAEPKHTREFHQTCAGSDQADTRDGAAHEMIGKIAAGGRHHRSDPVPVPETRPGRDDEYQSRFEKVGGEYQAGKRGNDQPPLSG